MPFQLITPQALANSSPGLLQPWVEFALILQLRRSFNCNEHFQCFWVVFSVPRVEATLGWN